MHTDAELIEQYVKLRAHVASRQEVHEAELKPYRDGMLVIENALLVRLTERGAENTKTEAGTAYKSTTHSFKVVDQAALLTFVTEQGGSPEMLDVRVIKDEVKTWLDQTGMLPPGVLENEPYTKVNIRRS